MQLLWKTFQGHPGFRISYQWKSFSEARICGTLSLLQVELHCQEWPRWSFFELWNTQEVEKVTYNNYTSKLSFFQFLINRNNTYTNQKLATFKEWISPLCTFCKQQEENINHLFWNCPITSNFITQCIRFLYFKYEGFNQINRKLNKENFIFGIRNESYTTIDNLVLMMIKKFIWNKRCKEEIPTINQFKSYLKTELTHYMNVNLTPKPDIRLKIMDSKPFQDFINQL